MKPDESAEKPTVQRDPSPRNGEAAEQTRLKNAREAGVPWKKWGPYLSERQWGTVREDYSENSDAWNFFTHDHARSRAYRWGEDGLAGISDDEQHLSPASSCATNMVSDPSRAARESSRVIRSGATTSASLNTFMATMAPGWAPVTKLAGLDSSPN